MLRSRAKLPLIVSGMFINVYLEAARLAIHALDCMDKSFPYTDRLR